MASDAPIAIVGVSTLFPGSTSRRGFWADILAGRDLVGDVPPSHWLPDDHLHPDPDVPDKTYSSRGAFLEDIPFSPVEYGIPPRMLEATDSGQLLSLVLARRVLEDALGEAFDEIDHRRTGVVLGAAAASELSLHMAGRLQRPLWEEGMRRAGLSPDHIHTVSDHIAELYTPWQESTFPGFLSNVLAGRVANRFNLGGHNQVVDAACASSLAAIDAASDQLKLNKADLVIAGGVDLLNHVLLYTAFSKIGALSPAGHCRPFSTDADGTVLAEGLGFFALQRLDDAEAHNRPIYAVIRGIGTSSDGRAKSIYAPRPEGQQLALQRAYDDAGYDPSTVGLFEAHGTATPAGDASEIQSLKAIFPSDARTSGQPPRSALGSIKSQIGHAKAAAGAAGLFKAVMALHHKTLPPTLHVDRPNEELHHPDSPLYLNTRARPWITTADDPPPRASVSAFGFGGTNAHITLEAYDGPTEPPPRLRSLPWELILLSAPDPRALIDAITDLQARLDDHPADLAEIAHQTQRRFQPQEHARLALITQSTSALRRTLGAASEHLKTTPERSFSLPDGTLHYGWQRSPEPVAFIFPGQGSQYLYMGDEWAMHFDACRSIWERTDTADWHDHLRLHDVVFPPPALDDSTAQRQRQRLTSTQWAQPSLGSTSLSILALLRQLGLSPDATAGHSYGELPALFCAGVFDASTTLQLSRRRGELMAAAAENAQHPGAMCAVQAEANQLQRWIDQWDLDLVIANHNSPRQCVLSGPATDIEDIQARLQKRRVAATSLPVATAFHSPLVSDSADPFLDTLHATDIDPPKLPVYANTTAQTYPDDPDAIRRLLGHQLANPVRFVDQIRNMHDDGLRTFIEVGPHSALTGLIQKTLSDRPHQAIHLDRRGVSSLKTLFSAVGRLATLGHNLNLDALWQGYETPSQPDPTPGPDAVLINGTGFNKPYPGDNPRPQPDPPLLDPSPRSDTPMSDDQQWLQAFREQQQRIAEAHRVYQESTAEAHRAFLDTMGQSLDALDDAPAPPADPTPDFPEPIPDPPKNTNPRRTLGATSPPSYDPSDDLIDHLIEVIADKTGYPAEMLQPDMELEADLGVDSIKQVEILADMESRFPRLEALESQTLSELRQIDHIADHMESLLGGRSPRAHQPSSDASTSDDDDDTDRPHSPPTRHHVAPWVRPSAGFSPPFRPPATIHLAAADHRVTPHLVERLQHRGIQAIPLDGDLPDDARAVISLHGLHPTRDLNHATELAESAILTARDLAQNIAQTPDQNHLWISTQGATKPFIDAKSSGDTPDLHHLITGCINELSRTAAAEWPNAFIKSLNVDIESLDDDDIAAIIVDELHSGDPPFELHIDAHGQCSIPIAHPAPLDDVDPSPTETIPRITSGDTLVVAGGGRGVTAACIIELARRHRLQFLILGRTELTDEPHATRHARGDAAIKSALFHAADEDDPPSPAEIARQARQIQSQRALRRTLGAITDLDSAVIYRSCDIRDPEDVQTAVDDARRRWGPIDAIVHGAGVLADAWIADKSAEDFHRVFHTKVEGYEHLRQATANDDLKAVALFSSIAAHSGNAGQSDYAMANGALNRIAHQEAQSRPQCLVKALCWGPWDGGMVTPSLRAHFQDEGITLLSKERGASLFADELLHGPPHQVQVILGHADTAEGINGAHFRGPIDLAVPISRATHPFLTDHRVRSVPVVPAVVVIDWFVRATRALAPHLHLQSISNLRVRQGLRLPTFDSGDPEAPCATPHITIEVTGREPTLSLHLQLRDDHTLYYEATAHLDATAPAPPDLPSTDRRDASTDWTVHRAYHDSPLFHGPAFQVLQSIDHCGTEGSTGTTYGLESTDWPTDHWAIDAPAIDGGLQLGFLWGLDLIDQPTLPLRIDAFHAWTDEPPRTQPLQVAIHRLHHSRRHIEADLFVYADQRPLYALRGLHIFAVPDGL